MGIRSLKTASISTGVKRSKVWDQSTVLRASSYESISTVTVGAGGSATVTFSSIPATYTHLQIRGVILTGANLASDVKCNFNGDTGNNYIIHGLYGSGSSTGSYASATPSYLSSGIQGQTNGPAPFLTDILDYTNTNKYTTIKSLSGYDNNSTGNIYFQSGLWRNTSAITSIVLTPYPSGTFSQYSSFALYGIKVA